MTNEGGREAGGGGSGVHRVREGPGRVPQDRQPGQVCVCARARRARVSLRVCVLCVSARALACA